MPRAYSYQTKPGPQDYVFATIEQEHRGTEVSIEVMWPEEFSVLSGRTPQYEFFVEKGVDPYRNELVDPIYEWLVENMTGRWHWFEHEANHRHSIETHVWIDDPAEGEAFAERWADRIRVMPHRMERDTRARERYLARSSVPSP